MRGESGRPSFHPFDYYSKSNDRRIWTSMNGLAQIIGPLIMYGIGKNGSLPLAPWRTMFLVCGGCSVGVGIIFMALFPTNPQVAWFLTDEERSIIKVGMLRDREGGDRTAFSRSQFKEAMFDVQTWFMGLFGFVLTMVSPVIVVSVTCSHSSYRSES